MSADEILAANLWPWPDPLLKRDGSGQILFVNAAFLQLYGGRIDDWRGNIVAGWPAPTPQGAQRFETLVGEPPHQTVYDWVEMLMEDGNAMAIARNVTALIPAPTPRADTFVPTPPPTAEPQVQIAVATAQPAPSAPSAPPSQQEVAPVQVPSVPAAVLSDDREDTINCSADGFLNQPAPTQESPVPQTTETPPVAGAAAPEPVEAEIEQNARMIQRRALPIEDSTAVLGTNWRDQVIAKAVGVEAPEDGESEEIEDAHDLYADIDEFTAAENGTNSAGGLRILLAEDNAINALLTRTLLEAEGGQVDTVEDGALAVEAVQKTKYDLILMDMRMQNMDGLESTRKIRALGGAYKEIPIVALTANTFDDDSNACFDSGMNDFMTKPVSAEELQEMVLNWTKERQKIAS